MSGDLIRENTWYSYGSYSNTGNLTLLFVGGVSMGSPNQSDALRSAILAVIIGGGVTIINVFQRKCWSLLHDSTSSAEPILYNQEGCLYMETWL